MDRNPASQLGQFVPIVRKLWSSSTFVFQRTIHSSQIRLLARRFNSARPRRFSFPEDTCHFQIREWLCSGPGFCSVPGFRTRKILSCVLHELEMLIFRGNLRITCRNIQILKYLGLLGGPDRDRTDDLFHAMEARSQLRHRPTCCRDATLLLSPLLLSTSNWPGEHERGRRVSRRRAQSRGRRYIESTREEVEACRLLS
jgi:hypothetical protein